MTSSSVLGFKFDTWSIQAIFVSYLEKTLYEKYWNGVCVVYTILNLLEKRKQQLGLYSHTKKLIVNIFSNDKKSVG